MGLMTALFGGGSRGGSLANGGHNINHSQALSATDSSVFSPSNPGNWDSVRSAPLVESPRYFSEQEAEALKRLSGEKAVGAKASQRAYKHLARIEEADATVHRAHYKYKGKVADHELTKLRANARYGRHLHAIRPDYARLGAGLERAETSANRRIQELQAAVRQA